MRRLTPDRISRLACAAGVWCVTLPAMPAFGQAVTEAFLWNRSAEEPAIVQQLEDRGVMTVRPIVIPDERGRVGANVHFGWPVAAQKDDVIVLLFTRLPWHYPGADPTRAADAFSSQMVYVRSEDGGRTWSDQADLRDWQKTEPAVSPAGMRAIEFLSDGRLIAAGRYGLFVSKDEGRTWTHHPDAFTEPLPEEARGANFGPNIIEHPRHGLLLSGHAWRIKGGVFYPEMWYWQSSDGEHFKRLRVPYPNIPSSNGEPSGVLLGDRMLFIGRSHDETNFEPATGTFRYSQLLGEPGSLALKPSFTNIRTSDAGDELVDLAVRDGFPTRKAYTWGKWSQDTAAVMLNPATNRVEVVATNRSGRGGANTDDLSRQSLNLWSIDPDELLNGSSTWRFEGTLLERKLLDAPQLLDGMHPAGATIDLKRGVQHIFIYVGYYKGPAGVFHVTRTLDTDKLSSALHELRHTSADVPPPTVEQPPPTPFLTLFEDAPWHGDGDDAVNLSDQLAQLRSLDALTIVARFKTQSLERQTIFAASDTRQPSAEASLYVEHGKLRYVVRDGEPTGSLGYRATQQVSDGQWHWAAVTLAGSRATLYLDGRILQNGSVPFFPRLPGINAAGIGRNVDDSGPQWFWIGELSHVRFWKEALTASQIDQLTTGLDKETAP